MLSNNSQSLYLCELILKLGNEPAPPELIKDVLEIYLEESLHRPTTFTIRIHNAYLAASQNSDPWRHQQYFKIGDRISIGFAASTTKDPEFKEQVKEPSLFEGEITAISGSFNDTSAHIIVQGSDVLHRLYRGRHNRSFENMTDSDIVKEIAQEEYGITIGQLDSSGKPHEYVFQENQTNMEFLRKRAARIGFELFVQDNKLYFRQPKNNGSLQLKWLTNIESFNVRVDSAQQVSSVEVRSWDYSRKELISETAENEQLVTSINDSVGKQIANDYLKFFNSQKDDMGRALGKALVSLPDTPFNSRGSNSNKAFTNCPTPKMIVVDQPVSDVDEAKKMAQALCNELGGEYVYADAKADGNPKIRPGKVVELEGMGPYSGKYYVTETRHIYSEGVYRTEFSVCGLSEGNLLSTLAPKVHLQPGQTLMVGIVDNNKDPKGWGRVRVKLPTLTEEHSSNWARVVGLGAGHERGCYWLPEIGDEVLVGFEHGDIHRPYIIGGVWNGVDKTVEKVNETINDGKVRLRTFKTRKGHELQFVDDSSLTDWEGVYLKADSGQGLSIDDLTYSVALETVGGTNLPGAPPFSTEVSVNPFTGAKVCSPIRVDIEALSPLGISMKGMKIDLAAPVINLGPQPGLTGAVKKLRPGKTPPPPPPPPPAVAIVSTDPVTITAPGINIVGPVTVTGALHVTGALSAAGACVLNGRTVTPGVHPIP